MRTALFFSVLAVLLSACTQAPPPPSAPAGPRRLALAFTGNGLGTIDPCGCVDRQRGGLARRATVLSKLRQDYPELLYVDYGNTLFATNELTDLEKDQKTQKAKLIVQALGEMKLAAYSVGGNDLAGGWEVLRSILADAKFPVLSANLYDAKTGSPLFQPWAVVETGGIRLGITATSDAGDGVQIPEGIQIRPAAESVAAILPELRAKSDKVVVLYRGAVQERIKIARMDGVDILAGFPDHAGGHARAEGNAILAATSGRGESVGFLSFLLDGGKKGYVREDEERAARIEAELAGEKAAEARKNGNEKAAAVQEAKARDYRVRLEEMSSKIPFEIRFIDVSEETPQDSGVHLLVDHFRRQQEQAATLLYGESRDLYTREEGRFAGAESCRTCHLPQYDNWLNTRHAHAFDTLAKTHQTSDQECLSCHTTGYLNDGGFQGAYAPLLFRNVQCESCHGPAATHVRTPREVKPPRKVNPVTCIKCHGVKHEETFKFAEALPIVACPVAKIFGDGEGAGNPPKK
ncbi:MAG: UshA-like (seleno)protein [Bdellovibrionota bacterium]